MARLTSLAICVLAFPEVFAHRPSVPNYARDDSLSIPPSQDPWYSAPAGYETTAPGTILRTRRAPGNLTDIIGNSSAAYNFVYRTTDTNYKPSWAVTTLFVPLTSNNTTYGEGAASGSPPLLSYQIPYNSASKDSGPSYTLYSSLSTGLGPIPPESINIAAALGIGWYVSVPDQEGPLAAFGAGPQAGHATLDGVRAVLAAGKGPDAESRYAMWGYSGGSFASEFAAELQASYAPELSFVGTVLGGVPPDLVGILDNVDNTTFAGLIPSALVGMTAQNPDAYDYLVSRLKTSGPYNASSFVAVKNMTVDLALAAFSGQDIFEYFVGGRDDIYQPELARVLGNNGHMGFHGIPQMPVFIYKAIGDGLTNIEDSDVLVDLYCSVGANILYQRNTVGGHLSEITNGRYRALEWLKARLTGEETSNVSGCTIQNVTVAIVDIPDF